MDIYELEILGNSEAANVYTDIFYAYDGGKDIASIKEEIRLEWLADAENDFEQELYLSGFIQALWKIGNLDSDLIDELTGIVENESSKPMWEELEKGLWKKRKKILLKFLNKIQTPPKRITPRKPFPKSENLLFQKGSIVAIKLDDDFYVALILTSFFEWRNENSYIFVITDYYEERLPELDKILNSNIYVTKGKNSSFRGSQVFTMEQSFIKEYIHKFTVIGNIEFSKEFPSRASSGIGNWKEMNFFLPFFRMIEIYGKNSNDEYSTLSIPNFFNLK